MCAYRTSWVLGFLATAGLTGCSVDKTEVEVKKITAYGLRTVIDGLKGKVVIVDFWAEY